MNVVGNKWSALVLALAILVLPGSVLDADAQLVPQDDAGSGGDAPDGPEPQVVIDPEVTYLGNTTGALGDTEDWYLLQPAAGGAWFQLSANVGNCGNWGLYDAQGTEIDGACRAPPSLGVVELWMQSPLEDEGSFFVRFNSPTVAPMHYRFSYRITDTPADGPPSPVPEDVPPQDDAGSGQDAPEGPSDEVRIASEVEYQGNTTGALGDTEDWYALEAGAGDWFQLRALGGHCNTWSLHADNGDAVESDCRALNQETVEVWLQAHLDSPGTYHLRFSGPAEGLPVHYRFEYILSRVPAPPPPALFSFAPDNTDLGVDTCPQAPPDESRQTHGEGDPQVDHLVWAALRTGFRAVVAWETPGPSTASLRVLQTDGETRMIDDPTPRSSHAFVVDGLPVGKVLCFQVEYEDGFQTVTSAWHAVRLENAMNAWDDEEGAYSLNLLVLANEHAIGHANLEAAMDVYAERLWDATEGWIRSGTVIVLYGDLQKHNSGLITCGILPVTLLPTCNTQADAVFSYDNFPYAAGATFRDGIQTPTRAIFMNNLWTGPTATPSSVASTLLHEVGHYAFGMMDLYTNLGNGPDCWDPETRISVMGGHPNRREFDDETTRCPNENAIAAEYGTYTPAWTSLIARYTRIPDRPGDPVAGPEGTGGIHEGHAYHLGGSTNVDAPQDDAGSGGDAPDEPETGIRVEPRTVYHGNTTGGFGDPEDRYVFEATAGSTLNLRAWGGNCATWSVLDATGHPLDADCSSPIIPPDGVTMAVQIGTDGDHYLRFASQPSAIGSTYRFAFASDKAPPEPLP